VARIFLEILAPVAALVLAGVVAGTRLTFDAATLAKLSYWILGPAFMFDVLASAEIAPDVVLRVVVAVLLAMIVTGGAVAFVARLSNRSYEATAAGILTSIYGNSGNFGLAVVAFTLGAQALPLAGIALLVINMVGLVFGIGAARSRRGSFSSSLRAAFTAPLVLAAVPAVVVNVVGFEVPVWLDRPIGLLSDALIPMMLLTLGVQLAAMKMPRMSLDIVTPLIAKLVFAPVIAAISVRLLGLTGDAAGVVVLQSAMPAAVFTALISIEHDLVPDLVTTIVLAGTVLSMLTLPVVIFVLGARF